MAGIVGPGGTAVGDQQQQQESDFVNYVAGATGFDPRVISAQATAEGAYGANGTGGYNYLNLATKTVQSLGDSYTGSSSGGFAQFANLQQAEKATVDEFRSPAINLGTGTSNPAGQTPTAQIGQIANTGWDAGHYGSPPGNKLDTIFVSQYGKSALVGPASTSSQTTVTAGGGASGNNSITKTLTDIPGVSDLTDAVSGIDSAFKFVFSYRFLEIIGGGALILVGLVGLMKEIGVSVPAPGPVGKAAAAVG